MTLALILSLVVLILSIIAHEVAHGYAANALGDPTARLAGRLTLNPIPHVDIVGSLLIPGLLLFTQSPILFGWAKPVPYNPYNLRGRWGETFVALAGVLTNFALALIFGLLIRFGGTALPEPALALAATITLVNLFLGLFNLIPFPPLDGFAALRSALPWKLSESMRHIEGQVAGAGALSLIVFLIAFSYLLATPFFNLVVSLFALITGSA